MQMTRAANVLVLALLAVGASAARKSSASAGLSQAREWLRSHGPAPPQDELQELKGVNPEAYAIVQALLTKRSLGLLDPRHPTASFAPGQAADAAPHESSVDFAASVGVKASSGAAQEETADDTAEAAPPPVHHSHQDWLNWRPADSAAGDDAQVQQVLGAASQLRAGGAAPAALAAGDAPAPLEPAPPAQQQGLVGVRQAVSQESGGGDYLKDFSWSDGDAAASRPDAAAHPLPPARIVPQGEALPAARIFTPIGGRFEAAAELGSTSPAPPRKQNALVSWLGSSWGPAKAPPAATKQTAASPSGTSARRGAGHYSRYLEDLAGSA